METLGEISELVFIGAGQAYTLSTDSLLTLYDTVGERIEWKKQLPQGENETYKLRHLGRNLIVYSNSRVSMINSAGHVIWEQPLVGTGDSVVEMFMVGKDIYSVFVKEDQVTVYKQYATKGQFRITE